MEEEKFVEWEKEQILRRSELITEDINEYFYLKQEGDEEKEIIIGGKGEKKKLEYVGGVDISFIKDNDVDACASFVVLSFPDLKLVYEKMEMIELKEPYIPGFLAFRECPPLVKIINSAFQESNCPKPDVLFVDGNGEHHTRGYGSACHFGVLLDLPTIGVGKTFFCIDDIPFNAKEMKKEAKNHNKMEGDWFPMKGNSGRVWGAALQAGKDANNPIYISVGHKISLETATKITTLCSLHRIPEPVRFADLGSRKYISQLQ